MGGFGRGGPMGAIGRPVEKPKNFKGSLLRLLGYLRPHRIRLLFVFACAILSTSFSIIGPKLMGQATTTIFTGLLAKYAALLAHRPIPSLDFTSIGHLLLVLVLLYAISAVFGYIQQYVMAGVAQRTVYDLREEVNRKLARLPLRFFDSRTHGEILRRVTNDIDNISTTLQQSLTQLITSIFTLIGVLIMMLTISPLLTLIVLVTLPLYVLVTGQVAKRSQPFFATQWQELGALNGHVEEMYTGHAIVKAFGHEERAIEQFKTINERLYGASWKAQFVSGILMPLMTLVSNIGYVIVSVVGGIFVTQGRITIGDVQAFIQYSSQFTQPIVQTANIANIIQSTIASAERVFELLDQAEEVPDSETAPVLQAPRGVVRFEQVAFSYDPETPLIVEMTINVEAGLTIAIVGPTGAGKTTLVNLLMRFYEVNSGRITVDGLDIRELQRGNLRTIFGMVLQDTWLFNGTIRENIAFGRSGATETEIVAAAQAAHADHFIRTLPDGYNTVLNEEVSNVSQGQKQLLTIARAFLADPAIRALRC
jgi:ATP-binding cassette subfamily B protein